MSKVRDYLLLFGSAGLIVAFDQWTKYLVRSSMALGDSFPVFEAIPWLRIVHWHNTGAAFGLLPSGGTIFAIIAVIVILAIAFYWPSIPSHELGLRIALALQMAGAAGNLISRLTIGAVTDFVAVGTFPVFNVADSSISIGVAVLIVAMIVEELRKSRARSAGAPAHEEEIENGLENA